MPLPTPNLDDRTWQDIVDEAKKMIPALCPQWTDFNPADPGITLVELLAWMTEMMIYRLNRVPEKNYIKFMELMGIHLKAPEPAFTWLVFDVAEGTKNVDLPCIPANTRVSGKDDKGETIVFETQRPLNLTAARLLKIYAQMGEKYIDHTDSILSHSPTTRRHIFTGGEPVPHIFYLNHRDINRTGEDFKIVLYLTLKEAGAALQLEWACWDGEKWRIISPALDETEQWTKSGRIEFVDLPLMKPRKVNGTPGFYLRIRLKNYAGAALPKFRTLTMALELKRKSGIVPDRGYLSTRDIPFLPVAFHGPFYPFGREAREDDALYISSEAFARPNVPVVIDIALAQSYKPPPISETRDLQISWEYYTAAGDWQIMGLTSPQGVLKSRFGFADKTEAFTHSGRVSFYIPADTTPLEILGERGYWIRIRISKGHYRRPAIKQKEMMKEQDKPPLVTRFVIFFKEKPVPFTQYLAYNDFTYQDLTPNLTRQKTFAPFVAVPRHKPELYLALDSPISNRLHYIFFRLARSGEPGSRITYEYAAAKGWQSLNPVEDGTRNLTNQGMVGFVGPTDWAAKTRFTQSAYWLRLRWESHIDGSLPQLRCIHKNIVTAINGTSYRGEMMGTGNGQPYQSFAFRNAPILPGPRILVKELDTSVPQEIENFKKKVKGRVHEEASTDGTVTALWVEWEERPNFFYSKRDSRHYMADITNGHITFGDAVRGNIPPVGAEIKALIYYTGGGEEGNMGRGAINNLETAIPYIDRVSNPYPASGGTAMETVEEAKLRAPYEIKHRQRAVTAEDYEKLALQAADVARVICLPDDAGKVKLIIVPEGEQAKLEPSDALKTKVRDYLDRRRLLTTRIEIIGPGYTDFTVQAGVVLRKDKVDRFPQIRKKIEERLRKVLHPLTGGLARTGWPIGRSVYLSDLYHIIDTIRGIDHIHTLTIDKFPGKEMVDISPYAFPHLTEIEITQAQH